MMLTDAEYVERLKLAVGLRRTGYYDYSQGVATNLSEIRPNESSVWHTLGQISTELGAFPEALAHHEKAMRLIKERGILNPEQFQPASLGLGQALMRYGRFEEGLPLFEGGRLNVSWTPWPGSKYWNGIDEASTLLVQFEGGYGDTFMFMRWLPLLKSIKGVKRLGIVIFPALFDFCDWPSLGVDRMYQVGIDSIAFGEYQYATSIMSMPTMFQMKTWTDIPKVDVSAIRDPNAIERQRRIRIRADSGYFRLGFCWRAEENASPVRTKSLPFGIAEQIIQGINNEIGRKTDSVDRPIEYFSLSPEKSDLYTNSTFRHPQGLTVEPERMTSWRTTAEYICSMDFVLTVDTAVAHLCGLLGVPVLVLLPKSSCWRWGLPGEPCHWYGSAMSLYRQKNALQWDAGDIVETLMGRLSAS